MDLFMVPTVAFDLLYVFVIVRLLRRDFVWINVTSNPTAEWIARLGADLVDAKGDITVKSDAVGQALDYAKRLAKFLPPDVSAWDNASNNKWLISGKGALIFNPPSAWAVAKRNAPQVAEKLWTHAMPKGPKGRFVSMLPRFQGVWNFSKNKSAAKSLMLHVSSRDSAERLVAGRIADSDASDGGVLRALGW
jgi:ABC-type glycerol-3-phosphate transport system substrate-binding protein